LVTPVLSDIVTFASATDTAMVKATTTIDTFCITGGPQDSGSTLEDNFIITTLLSNPQNKSVAKDVAQKVQQFYFRDISSSAAFFSSASDVRNSFLFCSHGTKFSMSFPLASLTVSEKLRSSVLDNRYCGEYLSYKRLEKRWMEKLTYEKFHNL
jgi:hypothetical protein